MKFLVDRLKEPSTWAGLAGIAASFGIAAPLYATISAAGMAIAGIIAVFLPELK